MGVLRRSDDGASGSVALTMRNGSRVLLTCQYLVRISIHSNGFGVQTGTACERLRRLTDDGAGGTQNQIRDFAPAAGVAEALFENAVFGVGAMRQSGDWRAQGPPSA